MITVRVPATSANLGPGFDSLGIALTIYNQLSISETGQGLRIDVESEEHTHISTNENNLVYRSAKRLFEEVGFAFKGLHINIRISVPTGRGLGSSSTAIVGGLAAANSMAGSPLSRDDIFNLACEIEGHPDNVGPAIYGGFTICYPDEDRFIANTFKPSETIKPFVLVPRTTLATKTARGVLPSMIGMSDAVFNISRSSLLVAALIEGHPELLKFAMQDRLHQQYRASLIPGLKEIIAAVSSFEMAGAALSGAGPSIICMVSTSKASEFFEYIQQVLSGLNYSYTIMPVDFDMAGFAML